MRFFQTSSLLLLATALTTTAAPSKPASFTWNSSTFLLNGEPYLIRGGQMDPQRVPWQLWHERLAMAKAMGLNTIFSYLYWDQIEPVQGKFVTDGNTNIAAWVRAVDEAGLKLVLRPGPYICGEHEWGGFPSWLATIPDMVVRSNNGPFLAATKSYLNHIGSLLTPYAAAKGGPILMAQVENEYGFYGTDHTYTAALAKLVKDSLDLPLYTNDGGSESAVEAGSIPGVLSETDGGLDPKYRNEYAPKSSQGPFLDGEWYVTWIDTWGGGQHRTDSGNADKISSLGNELVTAMKSGYSFSIYMFHGGTNWGYQNGADYGSALEPVTTSYDYGAPLDESGRPTDIYHGLRKSLISFVGSENVPDVPSVAPMISISSLKVEPYLSMFDDLPADTSAHSAQSFEDLGQATGFVLYRWKATASMSGALKVGDSPRDRVIIYVNGKRVGIWDATKKSPKEVSVTLKAGDVLDMLVENLGRVNFGNRIPDQRKGIIGDVTIGGTKIHDFLQYKLPTDTAPAAAPSGVGAPKPSSSAPPIWYKATFDLPKVADTFLELPGWTKGVVFVNGVNLGRFWIIGPQQSLYLPGVYLKKTGNVINVLNLEPKGDEGSLKGVTSRTWSTNSDPDA